MQKLSDLEIRLTEYALEENRCEVFLKAFRREPPEKAAFLGTHLGARCMGAPSEASVQTHPVQKNSPTAGSKSFQRAVQTCKDAAKTACPPNSMSRMPHVATLEQSKYLGAPELMKAKQSLVKWPIEESIAIATGQAN